MSKSHKLNHIFLKIIFLLSFLGKLLLFFESNFQNNFFHNIQSSYLNKHKSGHGQKNKLFKVNNIS